MASHIETTTSNSESISVNGENKVSICEGVVSYIEILNLPYVRRKTHILSVNVLCLNNQAILLEYNTLKGLG